MQPAGKPDDAPHLLVAGGGIAGLAAAYYALREAGRRGVAIRCSILEAGPACGGKLRTVEPGAGWRVEAGPDSFLTQKRSGPDLCRELDLGDQLDGSRDALRAVSFLCGSVFRPMPAGLTLITPNDARAILRARLFSPLARLRILLEPYRPPGTGGADESIASFVRRRFGNQYLERFAGPLLAGISSGNYETLSIESLFPALPAMEREHGSLMKAHRAAPPAESAGAMFTTLRHGMQSLVKPLCSAVREAGGAIETGCPVASIRRQADGFHVATAITGRLAIRADAVVAALPSHRASRILREGHAPLADALDGIRHVSSASVSLGFDTAALANARGLDGFGFLVPAIERRRIVGCSVSSTKFAHRAPPGKTLLRVFLGGDGAEHHAEQDDDALIATARDELRTLAGVEAEPELAVAARWNKGSPQYEVGHAGRIAAIRERAAAIPALTLAGNTYDGISLSDCITAAQNRAATVLDSLAPR